MPYRRWNFKVSRSEGQVVRALGGIAGATLVSRVLGFVRDMVVARAFGAGPVTDAFFVAFRIPNILRRVLAEGALSTAMIPVSDTARMMLAMLSGDRNRISPCRRGEKDGMSHTAHFQNSKNPPSNQSQSR